MLAAGSNDAPPYVPDALWLLLEVGSRERGGGVSRNGVGLASTPRKWKGGPPLASLRKELQMGPSWRGRAAREVNWSHIASHYITSRHSTPHDICIALLELHWPLVVPTAGAGSRGASLAVLAEVDAAPAARNAARAALGAMLAQVRHEPCCHVGSS